MDFEGMNRSSAKYDLKTAFSEPRGTKARLALMAKESTFLNLLRVALLAKESTFLDLLKLKTEGQSSKSLLSVEEAVETA